MTPLSCLCPDSNADRFTCTDAPADAFVVAWVRDEFARWLRRTTPFGETRLCDVLLAVNEALANAAEFAYGDSLPGTVSVVAIRDHRRRDLTVTVSDLGRWRETNPLHRQRTRGRGIPLMRSLADSVVIDTSGRGTSVCLRFDDVDARPHIRVGSG